MSKPSPPLMNPSPKLAICKYGDCDIGGGDRAARMRGNRPKQARWAVSVLQQPAPSPQTPGLFRLRAKSLCSRIWLADDAGRVKPVWGQNTLLGGILQGICLILQPSGLNGIKKLAPNRRFLRIFPTATSREFLQRSREVFFDCRGRFVLSCEAALPYCSGASSRARDYGPGGYSRSIGRPRRSALRRSRLEFIVFGCRALPVTAIGRVGESHWVHFSRGACAGANG